MAKWTIALTGRQESNVVMELPMETESLWNIKQQVEANTALLICEQDLDRLREVVAARIEHYHLASLEDYECLLQYHSQTSESEWQKLASLITLGESYFFRDRGQFALLREQILPELISARQPQRTLNIWSAGCSTGEEPYSLAILLDELLPNQKDWQIRILGTDINGGAIDKARQGIYGARSFRLCSAELQGSYFTARQDTWKIKERIRNLVEFHYGNLLELSGDLRAELHNVDLIMCRNVFIYFNKRAIIQGLANFTRLLREGGYLLTGHGEFFGNGFMLRPFKTRVCGRFVIYQKMAAGACLDEPKASEVLRQPDALSPNTSPTHQTKPPIGSPKLQDVSKVKKTSGINAPPANLKMPSPLADLFSRGDYTTAIARGQAILKQDPQNFEVLHLMAQAFANAGKHDEAVSLCQQMLQIKTQALKPQLLLAHIAEVKGDYEEAKKLLKKVISQDPCFVAAYLELSGLYTREHDQQRADNMRQTAVRLLQGMPPDQEVEPYQEVTAGELVELLMDNPTETSSISAPRPSPKHPGDFFGERMVKTRGPH